MAGTGALSLGSVCGPAFTGPVSAHALSDLEQSFGSQSSPGPNSNTRLVTLLPIKLKYLV